MQIETDRLKLMPWGEDDWIGLKPIATDPLVMRFITGGRPWTDTEIQEFVERCRTTFRERGFTRWKLVEKRSGNLIGFCGLGILQDIPDVEIGWWLSSSHWGQGLASEAAFAAFQDGTRRVGMNRIISIADPENRASVRIMHKLGLVFERDWEYKDKAVVLYAFDAKRDAMR